MNNAILFLVFNRANTTKQVFEAIRQARPSRLYVAADGPRPEKEGEYERVQEVREIATNIDWDCKLKTLFRDDNLGCKMAVSGAISWFFEHEEEGIILEDDCLPGQSFFPYCQELLERYRYDTRIMMISGNNFQKTPRQTRYSYYFSRIPHCWGWATWRRAWQFYNVDMEIWPEINKNNLLNDIACGDKPFVTYWSTMFEKCYAGKIDTWDYQWAFYCWVQSGLTILPNVNLVSNIGFGSEATHTLSFNNKHAALGVENMKFPLIHPPYVIRDTVADSYTDKFVFGIVEESRPLWCRIARKIYNFLC